jgi:hypothetical protein
MKAAGASRLLLLCHAPYTILQFYTNSSALLDVSRQQQTLAASQFLDSEWIRLRSLISAMVLNYHSAYANH